MRIHALYKNTLRRFPLPVILLGVLVIIGLVVFYIAQRGKVAGTMTEHVSTDLSPFEDLSKPVAGTPQKLIIPGTNINADVEFVGKDTEGFMGTPKDKKAVGWYTFSSKPAEEGNIMINGHYDLPGGAPGVFWQLKRVKLGDKVIIVDEFNRPFDYVVIEIYYLSIDDPERFKIFDYSKDGQTLTLITCGGVWLPGESTYNKRLIVRAQRVY